MLPSAPELNLESITVLPITYHLSISLRTVFSCAHLQSPGNKPEYKDAFMMFVIGLVKTTRHVFMSMVVVCRGHRIYLGTTWIYFSVQ